MSTATLNVWITDIGDPCHITETEYFVHVVDCGGNALQWCGKTYTFIPTKCGHLEIEIPPGCYAVLASQGRGLGTFGNLLTHVQVVRANCGDHVCVTLFAPTGHFCGSWFANAVLWALESPGVVVLNPGLARGAVEAVNRLLANVEVDPFTANLAVTLKAALKPPSNEK
jgi:hypothetical protein